MGMTKKIKNAKKLLRQNGYIVLEPSLAGHVAKDMHDLVANYDIEKVTKELNEFFEAVDDSEWQG